MPYLFSTIATTLLLLFTPPAVAAFPVRQHGRVDLSALCENPRKFNEFSRQEWSLVHKRLAALEKQSGSVASAWLDCLNQLGSTFYDRRAHDKALDLYWTVLRVRRRVLGDSHPEFAKSLLAIANTYMRQSQLVAAKPLIFQALAILNRVAVSKETNPSLALDSLAKLYLLDGRFAESIGISERSLRIQEQFYGVENEYLIPTLINIGLSYHSISQDDRALLHYERAHRILIKQQIDHYPLPGVLNNIAAIKASRGDIKGALELLNQALVIVARDEGENAQLTDYYRTRIAELLFDTDIERAIRDLDSVLQKFIKNRNAAASLPYVLQALSRAYQKKQDYGPARLHTLWALRLFKQLQGNNLKGIAEQLDRLAQIDQKTGAYWPSLSETFDAMRLYGAYFYQQSKYFSDEDITNLFNNMSDNLNRLHRTLLVPEIYRAKHFPSILTDAFILSLAYKNAAETITRLRNLRIYQACKTCVDSIRDLRRVYARNLLTDENNSSKDLSLKLSDLERSAGQSIAGSQWSPSTDISAFTTPSRRILKRLCVRHLSKSIYLDYRLTDQEYVVFVLNEDCSLTYQRVASQAQVDTAIEELSRAVATPKTSLAEVAAAENQLSTLLIAPIRDQIRGKRRLIVSLDGALHVVPIALLHDDQGQLIDHQEVSYVGSLLELDAVGPDKSSTNVVVLADPDFRARLDVPREEATGRGTSRGARTLKPGFLIPLPGTRKEAEAIQKMVPAARLYLGQAATEDLLLSLDAPGILHIATHGLFAEDLAVTPTGRAARGHFAVEALPEIRHPLLRSALALAGASTHRDAPDPFAPEFSDGIATALELAGMNLWGTQLVVLAACNSGRGFVQQGQGVYGLRRAFITAGAQTVVTALWRVDDQITETLMRTFYQFLRSGQERGDALRQAQLDIRSTHPHPYYWASFILTGETGPMRGIPFIK